MQRYEVQSGETLYDAFRVAVVSRHSPQELRAAIWSDITTIGMDDQPLRTFVIDFLTSWVGVQLCGSGTNVKSARNVLVPMDVGARSTRDR